MAGPRAPWWRRIFWQRHPYTSSSSQAAGEFLPLHSTIHSAAYALIDRRKRRPADGSDDIGILKLPAPCSACTVRRCRGSPPGRCSPAFSVRRMPPAPCTVFNPSKPSASSLQPQGTSQWHSRPQHISVIKALRAPPAANLKLVAPEYRWLSILTGRNAFTAHGLESSGSSHASDKDQKWHTLLAPRLQGTVPQSSLGGGRRDGTCSSQQGSCIEGGLTSPVKHLLRHGASVSYGGAGFTGRSACEISSAKRPGCRIAGMRGATSKPPLLTHAACVT